MQIFHTLGLCQDYAHPILLAHAVSYHADHTSSSGVEPPLPNRQMSYAQPSLAPLAPLDLGFLPKASASQYSLLEAVVGPNHAQYTQPQPQPQPQHQPRSARPSESSVHSSSRVPSSSEATHTSFGTSTEKSWDVLSDASLKMNREDQDVEELQKKVDKRWVTTEAEAHL